jgi:Mg2+ and Co2+ transporter CorA
VFHYDWHFRVLFPHHYHIIRSRPPVTTSTTDEAGIAPIQANTFFYGSLDNASSHDVIPANAMLYLLSNSLWDTNLRLLDSCIQHISFRNLRDPKSETNQKMHDYREALEYLHNSTYEAVKAASASPSLSDSFEELKERYEKSGITTFNPVTFLKTTQKEAEDVQEFLMQTFQLLMSSISVRESGHSAEQASRTTILTYLAILYLPLTVATGVFGMNIKEINNGTPKFFWVIIVMVILMVSTVIVYSLLEKREKRERRKKSKG